MSKTKKRILLISASLCCVVFSFCLIHAQDQSERQKETKYWTVEGFRHGPSFFPKSFYDEIKPLQEGVLDFKHYHTYTEMVWWFKKWAKDYPDLVDLYVAAKSFGGRDIYQLTVTNKKTRINPPCSLTETATLVRSQPLNPLFGCLTIC